MQFLLVLVAAAPLADYDALVEARAAAEAGDAKKAIAAIDRIKPRKVCAPDLMFEEASLLAAELLAKTRPAAAAERLLALPPDGARLRRAIDLLRAAEEETRAKAAEATLLTTVVDTPEARALAKALGGAGIAERLDVDGRMKRVRALLDLHESREANLEARRLGSVVGPKHTYACEIAYVVGKTERKMRRYKPAIAALADARKRCDAAKNDEFARRSALLEIQVRGIRGQTIGTRRVASWLESKHPKHSYVDDGWMIVAEVLDRRGQPAEAKKIYDRIRTMGGDQVSMAAWRLAFDSIRANDAKTALPLLAQIVESDPPRAVETARAHYWTYRLDPKGREAALAALTARPSFYSWLALDRLGREDEARAKTLRAALLANRGAGASAGASGSPNGSASGSPNGSASGSPNGSASGSPNGSASGSPNGSASASPNGSASGSPNGSASGDGSTGGNAKGSGGADTSASPSAGGDRWATTFARAAALHARGATELAVAELAILECWDLDHAQAHDLARAYHGYGAYPEAQGVLRRRHDLFDALTPDNAAVWRLAYSRAFEAEINEAATQAKVEPWFLMGLVREESTFDPEIVSWAGAVGLAQLMPPTAVGAYAEVFKGRLDIEDTQRLTDPVLNLRLGAHVLKSGLRRFGTEPLALAAYNGGPGLTARVLPKTPTDFDLWVETIPVKETRRYVKRVTETWGLYRFFYADAPFVDLPDQVQPR
ncbi:MAG: transglycosylase SLT domain-containing protein [Deltaproteobacteria bacterium]